MIQENKSNFSIYFVFTLIGAILSYSIGAAYASGQEISQIWTVHGLSFVAPAIPCELSYGVLGILVLIGCRRYNITSGKEFFVRYMGKYPGLALYYYTLLYVIGMLIQQMSGGGSFLSQYLGIPVWASSLFFASLLVAAAVLGLERVVAIISKIAPFLAVLMVLIAVVGLANPVDGIEKGNELAIASNGARISENLWLGAAINHCYNIIFYIPFFTTLSTLRPKNRERASMKEYIVACAIAFGIDVVMVVVITYSQIANYSLIQGTAAPGLAMAMHFLPVIAPVFTIVLFLASFTTASPIAVMAVGFFAKKGTTKYVVVCFAVVLGAFAISLFGSYEQIVNLLMTISGKIGGAAYVCAIVNAIYRKVTKKGADELVLEDDVKGADNEQ